MFAVRYKVSKLCIGPSVVSEKNTARMKFIRLIKCKTSSNKGRICAVNSRVGRHNGLYEVVINKQTKDRGKSKPQMKIKHLRKTGNNVQKKSGADRIRAEGRHAAMMNTDRTRTWTGHIRSKQAGRQ
jgi:hypothetical protein